MFYCLQSKQRERERVDVVVCDLLFCCSVLFTITFSPVGVLFSPARSLVEMASQPPQNISTELAELTRKVKTKVPPHILSTNAEMMAVLLYRYRVRSVSESARSEETAGS